MPLPGSHVLHPMWARRGADVAGGFLEDTLALRRPGGTAGAFDPNTGGQASTPNTAYWTGKGSVQVLPGLEQQHDQAEQQVSTVNYRVAVDRDAPEPSVDDVVTVVDVGPNSDPLLAGRSLIVRSVETGSAHWTRDLICVDDLG